MALSRRYHELKMPVIIMAGNDDRFVNAKRHSARLHQEIPQSELTLTPGAGHMIHQLVPEQVMSAIDQARDAFIAQGGTLGSRQAV
jgi:pimeloyl-ACP methyl ester carboxylesterase